MARGSSGGGGGGGAPTGPVVEMLGESGEINGTGRAKIRKKFFVNNIADLTKIPEFAGYQATNVTYNQIGGGNYEQNVEYAAQVDANAAPGLVETLEGVSGTFEMFTTYDVVPIAQHPNLDNLIKDFQGSYNGDKPTWPPNYLPNSGSGLGSGEPQRNPMYGVTAYKEVNMTFRHTNYKATVSTDTYKNAGKVVTRLPAGFPVPPGPKDSKGKEVPRRWMMQMPAITKEGKSFRVVQEYVLLDFSGIAVGLYEVGNTPGAAG